MIPNADFVDVAGEVTRGSRGVRIRPAVKSGGDPERVRAVVTRHRRCGQSGARAVHGTIHIQFEALTIVSHGRVVPLAVVDVRRALDDVVPADWRRALLFEVESERVARRDPEEVILIPRVAVADSTTLRHERDGVIGCHRREGGLDPSSGLLEPQLECELCESKLRMGRGQAEIKVLVAPVEREGALGGQRRAYLGRADVAVVTTDRSATGTVARAVARLPASAGVAVIAGGAGVGGVLAGIRAGIARVDRARVTVGTVGVDAALADRRMLAHVVNARVRRTGVPVVAVVVRVAAPVDRRAHARVVAEGRNVCRERAPRRAVHERPCRRRRRARIRDRRPDSLVHRPAVAQSRRREQLTVHVIQNLLCGPRVVPDPDFVKPAIEVISVTAARRRPDGT